MIKQLLLSAITVLLLTNCKQEGSTKDSDGKTEESAEKIDPLFAKIPSDESGLNFANTIQHDVASRENLFDYDYFYNGAGVGIEDINNDGLADIFFAGNQVQNKLFLNQGNMQFKDISETAGINESNGWSTGVTFVDIDNNGWMDIYVSQGGPRPEVERKNLLYINQKDGTFSEEAEKYGLADTGIGTQSAFFDYDKDGDLDCIVMNENELYGVDPINLYRILEENEELRPKNSSHLYRNDNGKFTDVTSEAGLQRPIFGLGLSVGDINNDSWLDIYIASDYYIPDALFINNGDGSFTDKIKDYTQQISYYGMGIDIADINNDNLQDIFVLDMASSDHVRSKTLMASMSTGRFDYLVNKANFQYQYMYNSLQLNEGNNIYSNIAQLSELGNTDWSWAVIMSDLDHDQLKDIFITNGYRRYALDNDLQGKVFAAKQKYRGQVPLSVKEELYNQMPSEKLSNLLYHNQGDYKFKNVADKWGLGDLSFSNGAATGDLDNDGDLDIVVNNMDENAFLYRNMAVDENRGNFLRVDLKAAQSEPFAKVEIFYGDQQQLIEVKRVRGYMSSLDDGAHFGLGSVQQLDSVRVSWLNGNTEIRTNVAVNQTLVFDESDAASKSVTEKSPSYLFAEATASSYGLQFMHQENAYDDFEKEILLPYKQSTQGPIISKGDVNGDGREDIFVGGASGQAGSIFINTGNSFQKNTPAAFENDNACEDMEAVFFDADNDGDQDLYVVSGGNEHAQSSSLYADRLYINDGVGNYNKKTVNAFLKNPKSGKAVTTIDYDKDGDLDIVVGNRIVPQNYPQHSPSLIYENRDGDFIDVSSEIAPGLLNFGIINKIISTDFNDDGWMDFVAVGEWTSVGFFQNDQGKFRQLTTEDGVPDDRGWWFNVAETDINNDGLKDYVVGNIGLNIKFKTSKEKPFKVYSTDFDDNGTNDIVLSKKYHGNYVPVRGRECSSQQMPFIKDKFPTYSEFANASLNDIYGEKLEESYKSEANEFRSIILINRGNGRFEKVVLPVEAQLIPVLDIIVTDVDGDSHEDLILSGSIYETEVETPRLDAISGLVLISDGHNNYTPLTHRQSGLYIKGNVKSASVVELGKEKLMISATNDGPIKVHRFIP